MTRNEGQLMQRGEGLWEIDGVMDATSVPKLLVASKAAFPKRSTLTIDCGAVDRIDSAGLALLVEWQRWAVTESTALRFCNIPRQMLAVAKAYGLMDVLPADSFTG